MTMALLLIIQVKGGPRLSGHQLLNSPFRPVAAILALCIVLLFAVLSAGATTTTNTKTYIIHMERIVSHMNNPNAKTEWYTKMTGVAKSATAHVDGLTDGMEAVHHMYEHVIEGFSARLTATQAAYLKTLPGVLSLRPDRVYKISTTHSPMFLGLTASGSRLAGKYNAAGTLWSKSEFGLRPDRVHKISTTHSPMFLGLTASGSRLAGKYNAAGTLWSKSEFGSDVIIGVMDTGVWPERASFGDPDDESGRPGIMGAAIPARWKGKCVSGTEFDASRLCNKKLIGARYYFQGAEAALGHPFNDSVEEYRSARDWQGHGTHTASTAAGRWVHGAGIFGLANGTAVGMAPKAHIAVYKVCWFGGDIGQCTDSDILAVFNDAIADGVDVISISIGLPLVNLGDKMPELYEDNYAIAQYAAMKRGIFVLSAAMNEGPTPATVTNTAPWITTVAATTQDRAFPVSVVLGNGATVSGAVATVQVGSRGEEGGANGSLLLPFMYAGDAAVNSSVLYPASVCAGGGAMNPNLVKGKNVLCENNPDIGGSYDTVLAAGGAGVIIAGGGESSDTNLLDSGRAALEKGTNAIPFLRVTSQGRETLMEYLRSTRRPLAKILPTRTVLGVAPAPVVADFSSRGPLRYTAGHAQWLKPDIAAPGVEILAAGVGGNEFAFMSGTSMACPHVSGVAALLKSVHPSWSPAAIRSALMTTATMLNNLNETITAQETGVAASPLDFGAGFIRPEQAMRPGLVYDMGVHDYLTFMCALGYPNNETRQIDRDAPPCPTSGGLPPRVEDANFPSFFAVFGDVSLNSSAVTFQRILTNVETGSATATYVAHVVSPQGYSVIVEPTTLVFTKFMEKREFTLTVIPVYNHVVDRQFATLRWSDGKHIVQSPIVIDSNVVA